ncbi:MAG: hypothetical protein IKE91_03240 [Clostridia bacterium]|nr:hypothetical protein [Clostridia bacterium]
MTDMEKLDHSLAELIRGHNADAEAINAQVKATVEKTHAATEAVRNFRLDTTQIDAAVRKINGQK